MVVWLFRKSRLWIFCFVCLVVSFNYIHTLIPFRVTASVPHKKKLQTLRILSWNISKWNERNKAARGGISYRYPMMDFIESTEADVVCLQEFFESTDPELAEANIPELKKRGYPHYVFFPSFQLFEGKLKYGLVIFSKFPILKSDFLENSKGEHSEGLLYADIQINEKIVRVFTTHLESPGIDKSDYDAAGKMKISKQVLWKIKNSYFLRNHQAETLAQQVKESPYQSVICGDLGDVPGSYAYNTVKGGYVDVFVKKGLGLGATLQHTSPTLRIDYIFSHPSFKVLYFENLNHIKYSDHYPLIADLSLEKLIKKLP